MIYCSVYFKPIGDKLFTYPSVVKAGDQLPVNKALVLTVSVLVILQKTPGLWQKHQCCNLS